LSLDVHGFALTRHDSKVVNFYDDTEVRALVFFAPEKEGTEQVAVTTQGSSVLAEK
jgi:hypothetical protein